MNEVENPLGAVDDERPEHTYPCLQDGATLGTTCEFPKSGEWVIITDITDTHVRFLNIDNHPEGDSLTYVLEDCVGCREHAKTARGFEHDVEEDGVILKAPRDYFEENFRVLGPIHPSERTIAGGGD